VEVPKAIAGNKRTRRFRAPREEARRVARQGVETGRRLGAEWAMRFERLTPCQQAELVCFHEEAERMGFTLPRLLDLAKRLQQPESSLFGSHSHFAEMAGRRKVARFVGRSGA